MGGEGWDRRCVGMGFRVRVDAWRRHAAAASSCARICERLAGEEAAAPRGEAATPPGGAEGGAAGAAGAVDPLAHSQAGAGLPAPTSLHPPESDEGG